MDKGKGGIGLLIGIKPKGEKSEDEGMGDDAAMAAADALIAAIDENDPKAVVSAFRSLKSSCDGYGEMGGDED